MSLDFSLFLEYHHILKGPDAERVHRHKSALAKIER